MDNEITKEELQDQLDRQNRMIQALQSEIGILSGEKIAASIVYQEAQQELESLRQGQIKEMDDESNKNPKAHPPKK